MMGLLMECLFLKAGIQNQAIRLPRSGFLELWVFGGPLLAGCVNLTLLIWARNQMNRRVVPVPVRAVPPHHLATQRILRPVRLEPYRPPAPTWCVGTVREIRQPGGSRVIVRTKVSHSIPYFRSCCRSVAR